MSFSSNSYALGCLYTLIGGACYALGGTCGQYLFIHNNMDANWLVPARTFFSGLILLIFDFLVLKHNIFAVMKNRRSIISILFFGMFATACSQWGFYKSIQYSNAAVSTVLAFMSTIFVLLLEIFIHRHRPLFFEIISVFLVILGTFFIVTHGDLSSFALSPIAFAWSILGAAAYGVYMVQPVTLMQKYSLLSVVGWGLIIGGIFLTSILQPWQYQDIIYNFDLLLFMLGVIVIGTICAFSFFLAGVRIVGSIAASVISAIDPVVSACVCVFALNVNLVWQDFLGMFIVIFAIFIMSFAKYQRKNNKTQQS